MQRNVIRFSMEMRLSIIVHVNRASLDIIVKQISTIVKVLFVRRIIPIVSMELIPFIVNVERIINEVSLFTFRRRFQRKRETNVIQIGMVLVSNRILVIHHRAIKMRRVIIWMVDNIVVCVQRRTQVFDVMKILMNVLFFHSFVEMVERKFAVLVKGICQWSFEGVWMKLVPIGVIVHLVGMVQHVRKRWIIVFLNHAIEMVPVSIK